MLKKRENLWLPDAKFRSTSSKPQQSVNALCRLLEQANKPWL